MSLLMNGKNMANMIKLGNKNFPTSKEAKEYFGNILKLSDIGRITDEELNQKLLDLLAHHPNKEVKIGVGVNHFYIGEVVVPGVMNRERSFCLYRKDGSTTDFSFRKCISGKNPTFKQIVERACRHAISPDMKKAKINHFNKYQDHTFRVECEETKKLIKIDQANIDHKPPRTFEVIVSFWIEKNNRDRNLIKPTKDLQIGYQLTDEAAQDFREYHKAHSKHSLRIVHANENSKLSSKHRLLAANNPVDI